ncbi:MULTISPECIES: DUF7533 family protein [Natrialbaceae]|uniref:DUF7533 family protein n=1 Tax=Natrialbaceae TaxID=1644061 RepID=UPI00207C6E9F|nr:hypothetical protein [Natronococcus sp. CG52]
MAGIIDTIKLAGILVLALPAALAGVEFLLVRGETVIGGTLILLAIGLVVIQRRLTLPSDIPTVLAKRVAGTVTKDGDGDSEEQ